MSRMMSLYFYEPVEQQGGKVVWRVADVNDDVVIRCDTQDEARKLCLRRNSQLLWPEDDHYQNLFAKAVEENRAPGLMATNVFDLQWESDMRAIKRWHDAGNDPMVWPDRTNLSVWLMEELQRAETERDLLRAMIVPSDDASG